MSVFEMRPEEVHSIATNINNQKEILEEECTKLEQTKLSLQSHWYGDEGSKAASAKLDEILNLYKSLITTVASTATSLSSAASATTETDNANAAIFRG